jgi:REP element-mobilizing transposase RayT
MPLGLKRYQQTGDMHYITFTCYHRQPKLLPAAAKELFEQTLERVRRWYGFYISAYVVMPEHVHLLISEPQRGKLWSSYRHWLTGVEGTVEIESQWTARKRQRLGIVPRMKRREEET